MRLSWNEVRARRVLRRGEAGRRIREGRDAEPLQRILRGVDVRRRSVARYYIVKLDNRSGFIDLFWPEAKQGEQKLEQLARWLEREYPSAAASLREGLSEMFTINRLSLPPRLRKCLSTTNLIDSTHSGVR